MNDYELDEYCKNNPECGCDCLHCQAFALNYWYNNYEQFN